MLEHDEQNDHDGAENNEADWALNEAISETEDAKQTSANPNMPTPKRRLINQEHNVALSTKSTTSPGTETRDFTRAYPHVLEEIDISQVAFIWFLKNFHKA